MEETLRLIGLLGGGLLSMLLACGGSAPQSAPADPPPPTYSAFVEGGAASVGRTASCVTQLADGRVLVTGGYSSTAELDTAEIFDPSANGGLGAFSAVPSRMSCTRYRHTATLLPNGKVLIAGGRDASYNSRKSIELFDPALNGGQGGFQTLGAQMGVARADHGAVTLQDGRILLMGGTSGSVSNSAEIFDPATLQFGSLITMQSVRLHHTATRLANGKVLVTGGDQGSVGNGAEIFDPAGDGGKGSFTATGSMAQSRYFHAAALLKDGRVLVSGGSQGGPMASAEFFDPAANGGVGAFTAAPSMLVARALHTVTVLPDGRCLVAGGTGGQLTGTLAKTTEWFDPSAAGGSGAFVTAPALVHGRSAQDALLLKNRTMLIVGGGDLHAEILR